MDIEVIKNSVVLIKSSKQDNYEFGTGFVIYRTEESTYILTCTHVIDAVGGKNWIIVNDMIATVLDYSPTDNLDLTLLRIDERFVESPPLPLCSTGVKGLDINIIGFAEQDDNDYHVRRRIEGQLGEQIDFAPIRHKGQIPAWDLHIKEKSYPLKPGYSGSPVIDSASGEVLAIVSYREGAGQKGQAISIENLKILKKIWQEIPYSIIKKPVIQPKIQIPVIARTIATTVAVLVVCIFFIWIQFFKFEEFIIDGKIYNSGSNELMNGVAVVIVDDKDNLISQQVATTGSDGKFIIKEKINVRTQAYILVKKDGCHDLKIPLNRNRTSDLQIKYSCQAE